MCVVDSQLPSLVCLALRHRNTRDCKCHTGTRVRHLAIAWAERMREEIVGRTDNRLNMR